MRLPRLTVFLGLALGLLTLLAGCGKPEQVVGGQTRPKPLSKVVSLSPSTTELVATSSGLAFLMARTASCDYPPVVLERPSVVRGTKPDYEAIAKIKPDLVVYDAALYGPDDVAKIKELGADVVAFNVTDFKSLERDLFALAQYYQGEIRASEYLDKVKAAEEEAQAQIKGKRPKVAVVMGGAGGGPIYAAGARSFQAWAVQAAGGQIVGPDSARFEPYSLETLLTEDPDVIVTDGDAAGILKNPQLQTIKAVKNRLVAEVPSGVLLRAGGRIPEFVRGLSSVFQRVR